jgi:hypothetical protein
VFWSVLYLILGRILQFLILLGRGDRAKEVEILTLRHQVAALRRRVNRRDLGDGDRVLLAAVASPVVKNLLRDAGEVAALAPRSGCPQVDLPAETSRPPIHQEGHS